MPTPYLSEIRIFSFSIVPKGWALCDGRIMQINVNRPLFELLGTQYGGDGVKTFALPNLVGKVPFHSGPKMAWGETGGESKHQLISTEIPSHTHQAIASSQDNPDTNTPGNNFWSKNPAYTCYGSETNNQMAPSCLGFTGQNLPHENMAPYLALNICIAIAGIFPS